MGLFLAMSCVVDGEASEVERKLGFVFPDEGEGMRYRMKVKGRL